MFLSSTIANLPLHQQIEQAAMLWNERFGGTANTILCHPADYGLFRTIYRYNVIPRPLMARGRFWIGVK